MSIERRLKQKARWLIYLRRMGSKWAKPLALHDVVLPPGTHVDSSGKLIVPNLGMSLDSPDEMTLALLRTVRHAVDLHKRAGASFRLQSHHIEITVEDVTGVALCTPDINVFHEMFVESLYAYSMPGETVVMDIGMNIGLASLYFASRYGSEVHAYELVPSTAEIAQRNIRMNPKLAGQITIYPFGLAEKDQELEIQAAPSFRPSNSLYNAMTGPDAAKEKVSVKDISPVLADIVSQLNGRKLVMKLDAEGAEYEIFERLEETGQLSDIDRMFLEWHPRAGKDPQALREALKRFGFQWFEREHPEVEVGLINAFRS